MQCYYRPHPVVTPLLLPRAHSPVPRLSSAAVAGVSPSRACVIGAVTQAQSVIAVSEFGDNTAVADAPVVTMTVESEDRRSSNGIARLRLQESRLMETDDGTSKPKAIRCTLPNCSCDCFCPGKTQIRICETCKHGWVIHALDKLGYNSVYPLAMQVEVVLPNIVFDIASLMLYGTQATPIRLKILLDRLFSVLQHDEVLQVLHGFGWTYEDYARGYILQERGGRVLDKWNIATREEEHIVIQQFLRFGETKSIAQEIILFDTLQRQDVIHRQPQKAESDIKKFLERSSQHVQPFCRSAFDARLSLRGQTSPRTAPSPVVSPAPRLQPNYTGRSMPSPPRSTSPRPTSPITRIQAVQPMPFDYRKDPIGAALADRRMTLVRTSSPLNMPRPIPLLTTPLADARIIPPFQTQPQDLTKKVKVEIKRSLTPPPLPPPPPQHHHHQQQTPPQQQQQPQQASPMIHPQMPSPIPRDHYMSNLSNSGPTTLTSSMFAERKLKHMRKSTNPMKRNWSPSSMAMGNASMISPSGKRRVVCTSCNKTFCDKGALKIHYSAVHLKEMHRCTVTGCNMLFSSRRSRNRHSANPNPKLHRPQKQKVPDGATVIDEGKTPVARIPGLLGQRMYGQMPGDMVLGSDLDISPTMVRPNQSGDERSAMDLSDSGRHEPLYYLDDNNRLSLYPLPKRARMDGDNDDVYDYDDMDDSSSDDVIDDYSLDDKMSEKDDTGEKTESVSARKGSKRKSLVPIRCKQEDEDEFVMSDDNDNDDDGSCDIQFEAEDLRQSTTNQVDAREMKREERDSDATEVDDETKHLNNNYEKKYIRDDYHNHDEADKMATLAQVKLMPKYDSDSGVEPDPGNGNYLREKNTVQNMDPRESGHSSDLDSSDNGSFESRFEYDEMGYDLKRGEYPIDHENPKRCAVCGKIFGNQFSVKIHFQNVHLKLMHTCFVDGCEAAFPSRRSRDRHSANLNLHRKVLASNGDLGHSDEQSGEEEDCLNVSRLSNTDSNERSDIPIPDPSGAVTCHVCQDRFRDNLVLKEHFEKVHPREMYKCTVPNCDKLFSTRKSRNRHSQNDNLHRQLAEGELCV